MSMPLALSFMVSPSPCRLPGGRGISGSLLGGGARADLIVRAVAAGLVLGGGLELAAADAARGFRDGLAGLRQVQVGGRVTPDQPRLEEAQLHPGGQPARHLV